jgi:alkylresorcinol/alkylpyrone synthase
MCWTCLRQGLTTRETPCVNNGNLSSVSVLDVFRANMADPPPAGSMGLMIAMGPAFCSELVLFEW